MDGGAGEADGGCFLRTKLLQVRNMKRNSVVQVADASPHPEGFNWVVYVSLLKG